MEIKVLASSSRGNAYIVSDGETTLLLECGIPFKQLQRGLDFEVSQLGGCLISHSHQDHSKAVKDMLKAGIDCYMSEGTAEALYQRSHRVNIIASKQQFKVGTWTILSFETEHNAAEPLGFLLASHGEKLLYATDTAYLRYRFQGLTHLMIECNYSLDILRQNIEDGDVERSVKDSVVQSHLSLETLRQFLAANDLSKVEEIWLLHLSRANADAERFKRETQEATGKVVNICEELAPARVDEPLTTLAPKPVIPTEIDDRTFKALRERMGFTTKDEVCKALSVPTLADWDGTRLEALDVMFVRQQTAGRIQAGINHWVEFL